jgi:hypothetical protein
MEESDDMNAAWAMIWIMLAFKLGLTIWILIAYPSGQNLFMQIALNWPWVLVGGIVLFAPTLFWIRLLRVRAKRAKLQRAEWEVDSEVVRWRD